MDEGLKNRLALGKYTRWAEHLTDDELYGILWLVGEFACRASLSDLPLSDARFHADRRKIGALRCLIKSRLDPMHSERVKKYIRDCLREPWSLPNDHGEEPGGLCCKRSAGEFCHEHSRSTYA